MQPLSLKIGSVLLLLSDLSRASQPQDKKLPQIIMATLAPFAATPLGRASNAIYTEAFKRLGYQPVLIDLPPARASAQASANLIDGELTRGPRYGMLHPGLARVDEPVLSATLSAYVTDAGLDLSGWSALRKQAYKVEYRMGIEASRYGVADFVPSSSLSSVPTTLQGLKKLAVGRTDVYVDFDDHVALQLRRQGFVDSRRIVWAGTMERFRVHAYLSPKNAALARRLSVALKKMRREGRIEAYRRAAQTAGTLK